MKIITIELCNASGILVDSKQVKIADAAMEFIDTLDGEYVCTDKLDKLEQAQEVEGLFEFLAYLKALEHKFTCSCHVMLKATRRERA